VVPVLGLASYWLRRVRILKLGGFLGTSGLVVWHFTSSKKLSTSQNLNWPVYFLDWTWVIMTLWGGWRLDNGLCWPAVELTEVVKLWQWCVIAHVHAVQEGRPTHPYDNTQKFIAMKWFSQWGQGKVNVITWSIVLTNHHQNLLSGWKVIGVCGSVQSCDCRTLYWVGPSSFLLFMTFINFCYNGSCMWSCVHSVVIYQPRPISLTHWKLACPWLPVGERNWSISID